VDAYASARKTATLNVKALIRLRRIGCQRVHPTGTVLVAEDNAEVADVTASLLERLWYRTLRAESATDALNQLQRGDNINLVLSGIAMPGGMNGIALAPT
jgi:CheY-like chemotaxis protein